MTEAYSGPEASTLAEALVRADLVVRGRVIEVMFEPSPTDGMPRATSTIDVASVIVGGARGVVKVFQFGGPVGQVDGRGALSELDVDPVLMPGDSVVLLLTFDDKLLLYRTIAGVGVNVIEADGTVRAQEANPFADEINGLKAAEFVKKIEAAAR